MGTLGKRWSTLDLDEAYRLYVGGMSFSQVASALGCTKSYVARRFREAGLQARPSGRPFTTAPPVVDSAEVVRLRDAGCSFPRIATQLGLSLDSTRDRYLLAVGRSRRTAGRRGSPSAPNIERQLESLPGHDEGLPGDTVAGPVARPWPPATGLATRPTASLPERLK